jgi:hypothetical protein
LRPPPSSGAQAPHAGRGRSPSTLAAVLGLRPCRNAPHAGNEAAHRGHRQLGRAGDRPLTRLDGRSGGFGGLGWVEPPTATAGSPRRGDGAAGDGAGPGECPLITLGPFRSGRRRVTTRAPSAMFRSQHPRAHGRAIGGGAFGVGLGDVVPPGLAPRSGDTMTRLR